LQGVFGKNVKIAIIDLGFDISNLEIQLTILLNINLLKLMKILLEASGESSSWNSLRRNFN